ncbi:hypothetical protein O1611_g4666 [Lasiodiplodia mahajangana]|uniref:Uncharacterized protein n=1 Tax=Lasiodiplodia mahajangana TaxID=1108764 RepID=A0ACC2JNF2_9PEZI|nr:hypothetical protein O1611_g4666 [Lasiodiplodia mahajangana]
MENTPNLPQVDIEFRNEVIDQLLVSVDHAKDLKASVGQFLANITAKTNHRHLAYHLFCTITLYISKQTTLDEEQMIVLCRIIEQLQREWSGDDATSGHPNVSPYTSTADSDDTWPKRNFRPVLPHAEPDRIGTSDAKNAAGDDIENLCGALDPMNIARSTTPDSFVREARRHTLTAPNFHNAVIQEDASDLKSQYPFGHRLMTKQGWSQQSGLGPDGTGIQRPIDADIVAHTFQESKSSVGLGYTKAQANDSPTETRKQTDALPSTAPAWHQYVADPNTGDKRARNMYRYEGSSGTAGAIRGQLTPTNANVKTIVQGQYTINDSWIGAARRIQDDMGQEVVGKTANEPSENDSDFVPHSGDSQGW